MVIVCVSKAVAELNRYLSGNSRPEPATSDLPGAGLPEHVKRKDWLLMPKGKPPFPHDIDRDIAVKGYCFFQLAD
jgi:hypothetical protein